MPGDLARDRRTLVRLQWPGFTVGLLGGLVYAHASLVSPGGAYRILALGIDVAAAPRGPPPGPAARIRRRRGRPAPRPPGGAP
ncbi:hypothetical protein ACI2LO_08100, partial [Streptomyces sp. NPDC033754]